MFDRDVARNLLREGRMSKRASISCMKVQVLTLSGRQKGKKQEVKGGKG